MTRLTPVGVLGHVIARTLTVRGHTSPEALKKKIAPNPMPPGCSTDNIRKMINGTDPCDGEFDGVKLRSLASVLGLPEQTLVMVQAGNRLGIETLPWKKKAEDLEIREYILGVMESPPGTERRSGADRRQN